VGYTKIGAVENPTSSMLDAAGSNKTEQLGNQICINQERGNENIGKGRKCLQENT